MSDDTNNQTGIENQNTPITPAQTPNQPPGNIMGMTLSELLKNNANAQNMVMQSMNINQNQFHQMLTTTGNNQMMNMTIGDLFKNGTLMQAMQVNPTQMMQMLGSLNGGNTPLTAMAMGKIDPNTGQMVALNNTDMQHLAQIPGLTAPKQSFIQKLKNLFS